MSQEAVPPAAPQGGSEAPAPEGGGEQPPPPAKKASSTKRNPKKVVELSEAKIGFVGAGKMTESIVNGLINHAKIDAKKIFVAAPTDKNTSRLKELGITTSKRNMDIFARYDCDIIFLAFHGAVISKCYKSGGTKPHPMTVNYIPNMRHPIYILSLVSGFELPKIKEILLNPEHPEKYILEMHRIMINAACAFGCGICAVDVEPDSKKLSVPLRTMLSSIAKLEYVPESQMDAACAICGSGLAFSYYFVSALADGAFKMGLSRNMALKFAAKTCLCASMALLETGKHPSELKDSVCAPKGAAVYGVHVLDKADVSSGITAAVEAAHKRAEQLCQAP